MIDPRAARRAVLTSDEHHITKLIALAIIEHMTPNSMRAYPSKTRLMKLCSIKDERTMRDYYQHALRFFDAENRVGKSTILSIKITQTADEINKLWPTKPPTSHAGGSCSSATKPPTSHVPPTCDAPPTSHAGGSCSSATKPPTSHVPPTCDAPPTSHAGGIDVNEQQPPASHAADPLHPMQGEVVGSRYTKLGSRANECFTEEFHKTDEKSTEKAVKPDISYKDLLAKLYEAAGDAVADEARFPGLACISDVHRWLESGCDLEVDILPTIRARALGRRRWSIRSWAYFTDAVADAKARRLSPLPEGNGGSNNGNSYYGYKSSGAEYDAMMERLYAYQDELLAKEDENGQRNQELHRPAAE